MPVLIARKSAWLKPLWVAGIACVVFLTGLACNLSARERVPTAEPAESLRQTLQAMSLPTQTFGPSLDTAEPVEILPAPAETPGPESIPPTEVPLPTPFPPEPSGPYPTVTRIPDFPPPSGDQYTYFIHSGDTAESI